MKTLSITNSEYHQNKEFWGSTDLKGYLTSPLHAWESHNSIEEKSKAKV